MTAIIVIHVLSATVWTGGHLVLALTVLPRALKARDAKIIAEFEHGYERLGLPALLIQVVTGFWLALEHAPEPSSWFAFSDLETSMIGVKVILLAATLGLAVHARTRVLPELSAASLRLLAWHIVPVTILSVLLATAGVLLRTAAQG